MDLVSIITLKFHLHQDGTVSLLLCFPFHVILGSAFQDGVCFPFTFSLYFLYFLDSKSKTLIGTQKILEKKCKKNDFLIFGFNMKNMNIYIYIYIYNQNSSKFYIF